MGQEQNPPGILFLRRGRRDEGSGPEAPRGALQTRVLQLLGQGRGDRGYRTGPGRGADLPDAGRPALRGAEAGGEAEKRAAKEPAGLSREPLPERLPAAAGRLAPRKAGPYRGRAWAGLRRS